MASATTTKRVTLDASVVIAICINELNRAAKAIAELAKYSAAGCELYAPGTIVQESLFVFCKLATDPKIPPGSRLSSAERLQAIRAFITLMANVKQTPNGDFSLIQGTVDIHGSYSCLRTSDSIYLALAEELARYGDAEIVTFDQDMENQARANAPTVVVKTLT
jgi:predicted nucleic acid-binding protein